MCIRDSCRTRPEGVNTHALRTVQIVDVVGAVIGTKLHVMVTHRPRTRTSEIPRLGQKHIALRIDFSTHVKRVAAHLGAAVAKINLDAWQVGGDYPDRGIVAIGRFELCREVLGPVTEYLTDIAFNRLIVLIPIGIQRDLTAAHTIDAQLALLQIAVAEAGTMIIVDIPIQL